MDIRENVSKAVEQQAKAAGRRLEDSELGKAAGGIFGLDQMNQVTDGAAKLMGELTGSLTDNITKNIL